jgi:transposase-like protein
MSDKFSLRQFRRKYGTHELCLEAVKRIRFPDEMDCPKCKKLSVFYQVKGRTAYACKLCGHHLYPLKGTIFEKSTTPLDYWFFAMYLMVQTRSGTSAKQLERMLGVTYKTAWRMFKQIRMLMADTDGTPLDGIVEMDETFVGGKAKNRVKLWNADKDTKEVVFGAVKRGGKAYLVHVPNTGKWTLLKQIQEHVSTEARVITDEYQSYTHLPKFGYKHDWVNHSRWEFVHKDIHTNNIEGVWSHFKRGVTGVYRVVSKKYLQAYVDEFAWRYNNRQYNGKMFERLLNQVIQVKAISF